MKKLVLSIVLFFSFFLNALTVDAYVSTLNIEKIDNNQLKLSMNTNDGFVRGIELKLKITGNIWVDKVNFNSNFANFTKEYNFNSDKKELTIFLATVYRDQNLLSENGTIDIGSILVNANETSEYTFDIVGLSIVNMDYETIIKTDIGKSNSDSYQFVKEKVEEPSNPSVTPNIPEKEENSETNNSESVVPKEEQNENDSSEEKEDSSNKEEEKKPENDNKPAEENKEPENETETEPKSYFPYVVITVLIVSMVLILIIFIQIYQKNKKC